jgi:hypothetical protein
MSNKSFCDICGKEVKETPGCFWLRKHGVVVEAKVTDWGPTRPRVNRPVFSDMFGERYHICHRCMFDVVRTGEPDPGGWSKEDMIELGIGNVGNVSPIRRR